MPQLGRYLRSLKFTFGLAPTNFTACLETGAPPLWHALPHGQGDALRHPSAPSDGLSRSVHREEVPNVPRLPGEGSRCIVQTLSAERPSRTFLGSSLRERAVIAVCPGRHGAAAGRGMTGDSQTDDQVEDADWHFTDAEMSASVRTRQSIRAVLTCGDALKRGKASRTLRTLADATHFV